MYVYDVLGVKSNLSKRVDAVASGAVSEIVITRAGNPVARLLPIQEKSVAVIFGTCKNEFLMGDDFDASNAEICELFSSS